MTFDSGIAMILPVMMAADREGERVPQTTLSAATEVTRPEVTPERLSRRHNRRLVRYLAGGLSAAIAVIYYLIGFEVVNVMGADQVPFGRTAGTAFLVAAVASFAWDQRWMWVAWAGAQVFAFWTYFDFASERTPSFEFWGITIRVLQVILVGVLAFLVLRPAPSAARRRRRSW